MPNLDGIAATRVLREASARARVLVLTTFALEQFLRRYYALFFIAHASRRVWLGGCTASPSGAWVTQQARNLGLDLSDRGVRFVIRDRDSKYSRPFDDVFRSEGVKVIHTPIRAPQAKALVSYCASLG